MKVAFVGLALSLAALGCDANAPPHGLEIVEHEVRYALDGRDAAELSRQLAEHRPHGEKWHGLTTTSMDLRVDFQPTTAGCRAAAVSLRLELTVWLPQWKPSAQVTPALARQWKAALAGLRRHEEGHRRHALDAVDALYRRLAALDSNEDCEALSERARIEVARSKARVQLKSESYDALTNSGARQGAVLPIDRLARHSNPRQW